MEIFEDFHSSEKCSCAVGHFVAVSDKGFKQVIEQPGWSPMSWVKGTYHLCWNWVVPEPLVTQASTVHTCDHQPSSDGRWEMGYDTKMKVPSVSSANPQRNQSWIFIGRTDAEAEAPILWPPDTNSGLIRKDPDAGEDWGQEKKALTDNEMVGWHHRLNGHESEQTLRDSEGQGSLACCSPWGHRVSHDWETEQQQQYLHCKGRIENALGRRRLVQSPTKI